MPHSSSLRHFKSATLNPSLKYMPKYAGSNYELRIGRCKMEDKGEYIVKAVNSFGNKDACAFLSVERQFFLLFLSFLYIVRSKGHWPCTDMDPRSCLSLRFNHDSHELDDNPTEI